MDVKQDRDRTGIGRRVDDGSLSRFRPNLHHFRFAGSKGV
jgi:hypothetical protein